MPQRFLRPGLITSKRWESVSWQCQSFYIRLITLVDDFGRYEADPMLLRNQAFPLRDDVRSSRVTELCEEIAKAAMVTFYRAADGKEYFQIEKWKERKRSAESHYPPPDGCELIYGSSRLPQQSAAERSGSLPPKSESKPEPLSVKGEGEGEDPNMWPLKVAVVPPIDPVWPERIKAIHEWYCQQMVTPIRLDMHLERLWFDWFKSGFDEDGFKRVFKYLRAQIKDKKRNDGAVKLSNLLQPDKFAEDLAVAQVGKKQMQPQTAPVLQVLDTPPTPEAMEKGAEQLRQLKEQLKR